MTIYCRMLLTVSLVWGCHGVAAVESAEVPTSVLLEKPLAVDPKADEITRLLIERRNAAVELLQTQYALFAGGKGTLDAVIDSAERALMAQAEIPGMNRRQLLQQHVKFAVELDGIVNQRFEQGVVDVTSRQGARLLRLEMELQLARAKLGDKKRTE